MHKYLNLKKFKIEKLFIFLRFENRKNGNNFKQTRWWYGHVGIFLWRDKRTMQTHYGACCKVQTNETTFKRRIQEKEAFVVSNSTCIS